MKQRTILFLCSDNSSRSQMAAGWTRRMHPEHFTVYSAGLTACGGIDPRAVKVMDEVGVDISREPTTLFSELAMKDYDLVVSLCGHRDESCSFFPGNLRRLHFGFDDPAKLAKKAKNEEEVLAAYRRVRDELRDFIAGLPAQLPLVDVIFTDALPPVHALLRAGHSGSYAVEVVDHVDQASGFETLSPNLIGVQTRPDYPKGAHV